MKKQERRVEARKTVFAATGQAHARYEKLARIEQAIEGIPEKTAAMVAEKVTTHITTTSTAAVAAVSSHVTKELAPLTALLLGQPDETTAVVKARLALQAQAVRLLETQDKAAAKKKREQEAAKKKEEAQAAKKQRQA